MNEEFISHKSPSAGFDYTSGKRIEQKLLDYNKEAERFGGYAYEEQSEVSPDHRFVAYTILKLIESPIWHGQWKDVHCFILLQITTRGHIGYIVA